MKKILIILFFLFSFVNTYSQTTKIVFKLNKSAPPGLILSLKSGNLSNQLFLQSKKDILNIYQLFSNYENKFSPLEKENFGLEKIFIAIINSASLKNVLSELNQNKYIRYSQEIHRLNLEQNLPNDPYFAQQYYLNNINYLGNALISTSPLITIGIIDSGLDFTHPDMLHSFSININESNNLQNNGIDDDGNGYIDDWRGWNFVNNTNDPYDDNIYSHGTGVAGIIAAGYSNNIGITSVTSGTANVLVLKCFDSQGIGYEDNVAKAILYSTEMNVKVLNMSFGDYIYSNFLKDIISYAYHKNIIMIASAGNDNSDILHYPSAYDEVISVAASDELNRKANFSAYGQTVDVYAPGVNILTTSRMGKGSPTYENNYIPMSGTSFAAPIVSSIAAMIYIKDTTDIELCEKIRGKIIYSAKYFQGQNEWDYIYSSGLSSMNALKMPDYNTKVRIYQPSLNTNLSGSVLPVCLTAYANNFLSYQFSYGAGKNPPVFNNLFSSSFRSLKDTVYNWDISGLSDTLYTIRLSMKLSDSKVIEHRTIVQKNSDQPVITNLSTSEIIQGNSYSQYINFNTNIITIGKLYYKIKSANDPYTVVFTDENNIGYNSYNHYSYLKHNALTVNTEYECFTEAIALNGKNVTSEKFYFTTKPDFPVTDFIQKPYNLPLSQITNVVINLNSNNQKTIFTNNIKNNLSSEVYNFSNNKFNKISPATYLQGKIIRFVSDMQNDNIFEVLCSNQRNGFIYTSPSIGELPVNQIWNNQPGDEFWPSLINPNENEFTGFTKNSYQIIQYGNPFPIKQNLPYINYSNFANSQNSLMNDFDSNGAMDVIFTSCEIDSFNIQNTNLYIYEKINNQYQLRKNIFFPGLNIKGDNLTSGNFYFPSEKNFAIGMNYDNAYNKNIFVVLIYKYQNGDYRQSDAIEFYNDSRKDGFIKYADIDADNIDELLVNTNNTFYVLKYQNNNIRTIYSKPGISTYNNIVYDFDFNGINELSLNTLDSTVFLEKVISSSQPVTPLNLSGFSGDSNSVRLNFLASAGAVKYFIYRSGNDTLYTLLDSTIQTIYSDVNVLNNKTYYYKVASVNNSNIQSNLTPSIIVYVHNKSKLLNVKPENNLIYLKYSQKISVSIPAISSFIINGLKINSVGIKDDYTYVLSLKEIIPNGQYYIYTSNLKDFYNSPIDTTGKAFQVINILNDYFYLAKAEYTGNNNIRLYFNKDVDSISASQINSYLLSGLNIKITKVTLPANDKKIVDLQINAKNNFGATGETYIITANIKSDNGVNIDSEHNQYNISFIKEDLNEVYVYPNPVKMSNLTNGFITFANLTRQFTIYIYNLSGELMKTINSTSDNGGYKWFITSEKNISSGVYFFKVEGLNSNNQKTESDLKKFIIIF